MIIMACKDCGTPYPKRERRCPACGGFRARYQGTVPDPPAEAASRPAGEPSTPRLEDRASEPQNAQDAI